MRKTLVTALLAITALVGCTPESENAEKDKYPPEARENFIDDCAESAVRYSGGELAERRKTCDCVIKKLEPQLPYRQDGANNDYTDADRIIRDGGELPANLKDKLDKATADCRPTG